MSDEDNNDIEDSTVEQGEEALAEADTAVEEAEGAEEDTEQAEESAIEEAVAAAETDGEVPTQPKGIDPDINLDVLLQVPVALSIEVGRTQMPISQLLETGEGSIIELSRHVGEPLDVLVNGTLIAKGVVVVVKEKFGLQITDIISPEDRVKNLSSNQLSLD